MNLEVWGLEQLPKQKGSYYRVWVDRKSTLHIEDPCKSKEKWVVSDTRELLYLPDRLPTFLRLWTEQGENLEQCLISIKDVETETRGLIWLPTAKVRPGSSIQGFVFHRNLNEGTLELCDRALTLTLLDCNGLERRAVTIEAGSLVSLFELELSEHDPTGQWQLVLQDGDETLDEATFEVIRFEKPEIEIQPQLSPWFLVDAAIAPRANIRYFFGEPVTEVKQAKLSIYVQDEAEKILISETVQENLHLEDGTYELDLENQQTGNYEWELAIEDRQSRTASFQGNYIVAERPFEMTLEVRSPLEEIKPDIPIAIDVLLTDPAGSPVSRVPVWFDLEGGTESWEFLSPPRLISDERGKVTVEIKFKDIDDPLQLLLSVSAMQEQGKQVQTQDIRVMPWMSHEVLLEATPDRTEYQPGEEVKVPVTLTGRQDIIDRMAIGSAELMGDVVVRSLDFSLKNGKGEIAFKLPKQIASPLQLKISLLKEFPEFVEREISIPVKFSHTSSSLWQASIEGKTEVGTGEPIQVNVNFPQPLSTDAKLIAWLIDRRIPRGTREDVLGTQFTQSIQPKTLKRFSSVIVQDWLKIEQQAHQTELELGGEKWHIWSYFNEENYQGRLIVLHLSIEAKFPHFIKVSQKDWLAAQDRFIKTLLSYTYESKKIASVLQSFPVIEEVQIYDVKYGDFSLQGSRTKPPRSPANLKQELRSQIEKIFPRLFRERDRRYRGQVFDRVQMKMRMPPVAYAAAGGMFKRSAIDESFDNDDDFLYASMDYMMEESAFSEEENPISLVVREDFIEVECLEPISLNMGATSATVEFKGSDAITEYDIVIFAIGASDFGTATHRVTVKNPLFSTIKNPPQLIWGDRSTLTTIVQNLSDRAFAEIKLGLRTEKIRASRSQETIATLAPRGSTSVDWAIEAVEVGNADVTLSLETEGFLEISKLDTPLRVQPPGEPQIQRYTAPLSEKNPVNWQFDLSGEEIFVLGIISLMPNARAAVIEGVESLATYPYGCCEQTYASTLPNYVLYQYLQRHDDLTPELANKLTGNLEAGRDRYLTTFRNAQSGGFGLWDGNNTSIFHTALAFSILSLIREIVSVEQEILDGAIAYLLEHRTDSGSWQPQSSLETPFPSTLSEAGNTTFIFHSASLAGIPLPETLHWLQENVSSYKNDTTCLALVLDSLTRREEYKETHADFMTRLKKALITVQQPDGSWHGQSSLSGEVETTAYAMMALGRAFPAERTVKKALKAGLDYLLANRRSTGWYSTRDTLYASWAIGEVGHLAWSDSDATGIVDINLNSNAIAQFDFSQVQGVEQLDLLYRARRIYWDQFTKGKNLISCQSKGGFNAHVLIELQVYSHPSNASETETVEELGSLDIRWDAKELTVGDRSNLHLQFTPNQHLEALLIEIPLAAGLSFDPNTSLPSQFLQIDSEPDKVALFTSNLVESVQIEAAFLAELPGEVQVNPIRIYQMYAPDAMTLSASTQLVVTKG